MTTNKELQPALSTNVVQTGSRMGVQSLVLGMLTAAHAGLFIISFLVPTVVSHMITVAMLISLPFVWRLSREVGTRASELDSAQDEHEAIAEALITTDQQLSLKPDTR